MTDSKTNIAKTLLDKRNIKPGETSQFQKLKLGFNPFPRAGISDLNSPSGLIEKLAPIDLEVEKLIEEYVLDSLGLQYQATENKFISTVIRGDYGSGKTQTLLYIKFLLESFSELKDLNKRPYVIYIDNPGVKLTELIGGIISQIGEENFKRYIWDISLNGIALNESIKTKLLQFIPRGVSLFEDNTDPFDPVNLNSYKSFLDAWYLRVLNSNPKRKKEFLDLLKTEVVQILQKEFNNPTVSLYFFELLSENIGINKAWEALTSGEGKSLDKKEVHLLKAIVQLITKQGYTDFYILVDEFEDITEGRLNTQELDKYLKNLRALIDKDRTWCAVFSMTSTALQKLKSASPPLAERISGRIIDLKSLNEPRAKAILINYLNLARPESSDLFPFDDSGINILINLSHGIPRVFLKSCFSFIQRALEELKEGDTIDEQFVTKHFQIEEE